MPKSTSSYYLWGIRLNQLPRLRIKTSTGNLINSPHNGGCSSNTRNTAFKCVYSKIRNSRLWNYYGRLNGDSLLSSNGPANATTGTVSRSRANVAASQQALSFVTVNIVLTVESDSSGGDAYGASCGSLPINDVASSLRMIDRLARSGIDLGADEDQASDQKRDLNPAIAAHAPSTPAWKTRA